MDKSASNDSTVNKRSASTKPKSEDKGNEAPAEKAKGGFMSSKTAIVLVVIVAVCVALKMTVLDKVDIKAKMEEAVKFVEDSGDMGMAWYCLITFVGVICLVPTTPMEIAGGFLFSPKWGMWTVLAFTGTSKIAANIVSVLIASLLLQDYAENLIEKNEFMKIVKKSIFRDNATEWKMVMLVRGAPIPLAVKNYGLGVMGASYFKILCGSLIFTNFYAAQNIIMGASMENLAEVFAPKKKGAAAAGSDDPMEIAKKMAPIAFQVVLIIVAVMVVKDVVKKVKEEEERKDKEASNETKKGN